MCIARNLIEPEYPGMARDFSIIQIMNAALISEGFDDIVSTNDGSVEWRLMSRNWPLIVEAELENGRYNFSRKQAELLSRQDGKFGYPDAYLVPSEAIHVRRLWTEDAQGCQDTDVDWVQDGERVFATAPSGVFIEYTISPDPSLFSANFSRGVQMMLQAVLLSVKEEKGEAQAMEAGAQTYFQNARTNSSKSRSATEPFKTSRFAAARFSRG